MRQDRRAARALEIEAAAYAVLEEKGFDGLTMLAVAKAAKASNETLYRWYGDKSGLFEALIRRNTEGVAEVLKGAEGRSVRDTLARVGPDLLAMLLGPRAVALNRAAAADGSGALGGILAEAGRGVVGPWIGGVMGRGLTAGEVAGASAREMAESYFALLIGDQQIRRVIGAMPEPTPEEIADRAERALGQFLQLYSAGDLDVAGPEA